MSLAIVVTAAALQPPPILRAPAALGELPPASGRRAVLAAGLLAALPAAARAVGPETIKLEIKGYAEVTCPPELAQGRAGGSLGAGASSGASSRVVRRSRGSRLAGRAAAARRAVGRARVAAPYARKTRCHASSDEPCNGLTLLRSRRIGFAL